MKNTTSTTQEDTKCTTQEDTKCTTLEDTNCTTQREDLQLKAADCANVFAVRFNWK